MRCNADMRIRAKEMPLNKISKKSPRSSASVDELPLNFLEFSFAVSKIIIIFVA